MPKIIENLREQILTFGKTILLKEGYHALTMRRIAAENNIAVGTVYNYYASKDILIASIMLEDWMKIISGANTKVMGSGTVMDGIHHLYDAICRFAATYQGTWKEYGDMPPMYMERHTKLIDQISEQICLLMREKQVVPSPDPSHFLAEILLHAAISGTAFSAYEPFIAKLL